MRNLFGNGRDPQQELIDVPSVGDPAGAWAASDPGGIPAPAATPMRDQRRHRLGRGAGVVIAAIVLGAGWSARSPLMPTPDPPPTQRAASEKAAGHAASDPASASAGQPQPRVQVVYDLQFVDRRHGFALTGSCAPTGQECREGFVATSDGGKTWERRPLPLPGVADLEQGFAAELYSLGRTSALVGNGGTWWMTSDSGRYWREIRHRPGVRADSIPPGGRLDVQYGADDAPPQLVVTDPRTGARFELRAPALDRIGTASGLDVMHDGGRWVTGTSKDNGAPAVAITRDEGRSWIVATLPHHPGLLSVRVLTGASADIYAVVIVQRPGAKNGFGAIYRSSDAGRSWTLVPPLQPGAHPASMLGGIVLRDGRLLVGTELQHAMISADGGRSFAPLRKQADLSWLTEVDGRYIASDSTGGHHLSTDGVRWQRLQIPV